MPKSSRKSVALTDIRFDDERLNRLVQVLRAQERELSRLTHMLDGGIAGQVLTKVSNEDYDADWIDP